MKLIAYLIITLSVIAGSLASATAYLAPVDSPDDQLIGLELTSAAGSYRPNEVGTEFKDQLKKIQDAIDKKQDARAENPLKPEEPAREPIVVPEVDRAPTGESTLAGAEKPKPIGRTGDTLNADLLALLRAQDVEFVKVNRFDFFRWPHWWLFLLSCAGLLGGALLVRHQRKSELARASMMIEGAPENPADARTVFARLSGRLDELSKDLDRATTRQQKLDAIVHRVGNIQRDDVPAFVADRPALVGRMGLGGYAELMDHFAGMERQLNRAWSAAADGHLEEALDSLKNAQPMLIQTLTKLKG